MLKKLTLSACFALLFTSAGVGLVVSLIGGENSGRAGVTKAMAALVVLAAGVLIRPTAR